MMKKLKIAVGGDHAGFSYKPDLVEYLMALGHEVKDFGTYSDASVDYPDFAHPVSSAVESGEFDFGLLLCGSANGVAITANKHQGVRAAIVWQVEIGELARSHNNANIICMPTRFISLALAKECLFAFLNTEFEGGRHQNRVNKMTCP